MDPHNKIVQRVAQRTLKPAGCLQKGKSRTWLDDRGWFLTVVELQPKFGAQGTFLNVGTMWLWYPRDHIAFDTPATGDTMRVSNFIQYRSDAQFEVAVQAMTNEAAELVATLRERYRSPQSVTARLKATVWDAYHRAAAAILSDDRESLAASLALIADSPASAPWQHALKSTALELTRANIDAHIAHTRAALRLPPLADPLP